MEKKFEAAGKRIAELRGQLTQAEFATRLDVDRKTVVRWEAGERLPDGASLFSLMREFGADVNYILTGQRSQAVAPQELLNAGDRVLLDNFHAASPQMQAGIKTMLGAFAPDAGIAKKKAANGGR